MDLGLNDRVFIVTGASAGLGFASAAALATDGARIVLCSRSQQRVDAAVAALREQATEGRTGAMGREQADDRRMTEGDRVVGVAVDLGDSGSAQMLYDAAISTFGRVDGAVLSVGGPPAGGVGQVEDEVWRDSFEKVFLGPLRVARTVLNSGGDKAITFVLSTSVKTPVVGLGISNALRPGLAGAGKSLAEEFGPSGSRVNFVLPGRLETDRMMEIEGAAADPAAMRASFISAIPLGRYGRPEELGRVAAFLSSPAASYVNGVAVAVDGGMTRTL